MFILLKILYLNKTLINTVSYKIFSHFFYFSFGLLEQLNQLSHIRFILTYNIIFYKIYKHKINIYFIKFHI